MCRTVLDWIDSDKPFWVPEGNWEQRRIIRLVTCLRLLVIEPILVLNLVRARSSWLGLGTEPPADRSPYRRIAAALYECAAARTHGPLSSAVKLGGGRSLTDRPTRATASPAAATRGPVRRRRRRRRRHAVARSPNGDVDRNSISIVS